MIITPDRKGWGIPAAKSVRSARYQAARIYGPVTHQVCTHCHIDKPASEFFASKRWPGGLQKACKECEKVVKREWYAHGGEVVAKRKVAALARYHRNKEDPAWMERTREQKRQYQRRRREAA